MNDADNRAPIDGMKVPVNGLTGREYSGQNVPELQTVMLENDFKSNEFVTFNQAINLGMPVPLGVKSCGHVTRWVAAKGSKKAASRKNKKAARLFPKMTAVWNLEQIDTENYEG